MTGMRKVKIFLPTPEMLLMRQPCKLRYRLNELGYPNRVVPRR